MQAGVSESLQEVRAGGWEGLPRSILERQPVLCVLHHSVCARLETYSVKDRIAARMVLEAERQGLIQPGKTTLVRVRRVESWIAGTNRMYAVVGSLVFLSNRRDRWSPRLGTRAWVSPGWRLRAATSSS